MSPRRLFLTTACAALLTLAGAARAADITWSIGPDFGGVDGHLGILTNGTLVAAVHTRGTSGPAEVVDPTGIDIAFTPINTASFSSAFTDPPNGIGDPAWSAIVATFEWTSGQDVTATDLLTGLTPGNTYQVQLFAGRSHGCCAARSQRFGDGNGNFSDPIDFAPLDFISVVGTFVADGTAQTLVFDDSTNNPALSAFVLRDVTGLPEPEAGAWAALAGLAALIGYRSRAREHGANPKEEPGR